MGHMQLVGKAIVRRIGVDRKMRMEKLVRIAWTVLVQVVHCQQVSVRLFVLPWAYHLLLNSLHQRLYVDKYILDDFNFKMFI